MIAAGSWRTVYIGQNKGIYPPLQRLGGGVVAYNTGSVCSIAVAAFVAAEERYCSGHAMFLVHPTSFNPPQGMTANRLETTLQAALADDLRTENILRERANIPDVVLEARKSRDVHITPTEAVQFGIVHGIKEFTLPNGQQIIQI